MANVPYRDIPAKLAKREAFQGNSMSAHWDGDSYRVLSYETTIAIYDRLSGNWVVIGNYYSRTTSKHQHLVDTYGIGGAR